MKQNVLQSILILALLSLFSCVKDSDELVFDNPLDKDGTNWHSPLIDSVYISDSITPIYDTVLFTIKADPQEQHDALDSAFYYDGQTFETVGRPFDNGYAVLPLSKNDSGNYSFDYWISDKVGRRTEKADYTFRVDLFKPTIGAYTTGENPQVPSGQELEINLDLFASDENGSIKKYYYKTEQLDEWNEQDSPEIKPKWTIDDDSQTEFDKTLFLKVMDDDSLESEEKEVTVKVTRVKPTIKTFDTEQKIEVNKPHGFFVIAEDSDNDVVKYRWAIGKGGASDDYAKETTEPGFDTTFTEAATYFIRVKAVDEGNVESYFSEQRLIVSNDKAPTVSINGSAEINQEKGTTVNFSVTGQAYDGKNINGFIWNIPSLSFEKVTPTGEFNFVFDDPGEYTVSAKAIDSDEILSEDVEYTVTITGSVDKPTVSITNPKENTIGIFRDEEIMIEATSSLASSEIKNYEWKLGNMVVQSSSSNTLTYTFNKIALTTKNVTVLVRVFSTDDKVSDYDTLYVTLKDGNPEITEIIHNLQPIQHGSGSISVKAGEEFILNCRAKDSNTITGKITKIIWVIEKEGSTVDPIPHVVNIEGVTIVSKFVRIIHNTGKYHVAVVAVDNEENHSEEFNFTIFVTE